jgi:hypothetical protein
MGHEAVIYGVIVAPMYQGDDFDRLRLHVLNDRVVRSLPRDGAATDGDIPAADHSLRPFDQRRSRPGREMDGDLAREIRRRPAPPLLVIRPFAHRTRLPAAETGVHVDADGAGQGGAACGSSRASRQLGTVVADTLRRQITGDLIPYPFGNCVQPALLSFARYTREVRRHSDQLFFGQLTMTDVDLNSSDFLFELRSATRDVLGMYWDMVTTYSGFGHSVDTGSLNFLRFVDLPVEQADPSILEELQLVRIGSAIAILCQVDDSWLEYDTFPADSPYYRGIAEALESGRLAHLPEFETAVRAGLASFASFRAAANPLYEKYVVGYFQYLAGHGPDPNALDVPDTPSLLRTPGA